MNIACLFGHKWNDCKCERCGKIRDTNHTFERIEGVEGPGGCRSRCKKCGMILREDHVFISAPGKCMVKCEKCGYQKSTHTYQNYRCTKCGKIKEMTPTELMLLPDAFRAYIQAKMQRAGAAFSVCASESSRYTYDIKMAMYKACRQGFKGSLDDCLKKYLTDPYPYDTLTTLGSHALYTTAAAFGTEEDIKRYQGMNLFGKTEESKGYMIELLTAFYQKYVLDSAGLIPLQEFIVLPDK